MKILIVDDERMALENLKSVVEEVEPDATIFTAKGYREALDVAERDYPEIAMLDVQMPGMTGIELAKKIKTIIPTINIIFVTAFSEFALDALGLYASGYLLKPASEKDVKEAIDNLRFPIRPDDDKIKVQCFGNFEIFHAGHPVRFGRFREKEILAYLIDRRGASVSLDEMCTIFWEDDGDLKKNKHLLRNVISELRKDLAACDMEDIFLSARNSYSIDKTKLDCDFYRVLAGDPAAAQSFHGEYMTQFSWAETTLGELERMEIR